MAKSPKIEFSDSLLAFFDCNHLAAMVKAATGANPVRQPHFAALRAI
jgi:hypothetical protein